MELWDVLDGQGNRTGRTMIRGSRIQKGDYHLVVHIWAKNERGEYLIQKRSQTVRSMPGMWASTSGSVVAGEESLETAVREVREELGITARPEELEFLCRMTRRHDFADVYLLRKPFRIEELVLQPEEVERVMWASEQKIRQMIREGTFHNYGRDYFRTMFSV